jgi:rRNA maturation RNase YbeY
MLFLNNEVGYGSFDVSMIEGWLVEVCTRESRKLGEVGVFLVDDETLLSVNKQYLEHDYYTDIITFDNGYRNIVTGELWISIDRVRDNANHNGISVSVELHRVVVHGVLHLIGYGDATITEKELMRSKENTYLELLN